MNQISIGAAPAPAGRHRAWWLLAMTVVAAAALWQHGPIAQWAHYHHFADARGWWAIPNAANVLSNLPFLLIGLWAIRPLTRRIAPSAADAAWICFAVAVACTAFGSALYHWSPSNGTLVFDRLPIAWACASLLCALLGERVDPAFSRAVPLAGALLFASLSVGFWWWSEVQGRSDLRLYAAVQFLPMLLVPAALLLRLPPTCATAVAGRDWCIVLVLYASAKLLEGADEQVLGMVGWLSGHTLKHLLAAAAAGWLLRAVVKARQLR
jgi:hypothetical protein